MTSPTGGPGRDPVEERLRGAMSGAALRYQPRPVPMQHILRAGRVRRARRRTLTTAACACLVVCLALPVARVATGHTVRPPRTPTAGIPSRAPGPPVPHAPQPVSPISERIGSGTVNGLPWSVRFTYYPQWPAGYPTPGAPAGDPAGGPLLCETMTIGGTTIDQDAHHAWTDCDDPLGRVDDDPSLHEGTGPGQSGDILYIGTPQTDVTHAIVTLTDGTQQSAPVITLPHTPVRAYAIAYGPGRSIASCEEFDTHGNLVRSVYSDGGGVP